MKVCTIGACWRPTVAAGLCRRHYDANRRRQREAWRPFVGYGPERSTQIACKCASPKWDTCGPLFPRVHVCRWCGSPKAEEFGKRST